MDRRILPRAAFGGAAFGLFLAAGGPARAQEPPDATRAVSREVTIYFPPEGAEATAGISREVTFYIPAEGEAATRSVSREVTMFIPEGALSTLATSREVTALFNYSLTDVRNALRIAAGLQPAPAAGSWDFHWLDAAPPTNVIDVLDAAAVAYGALHP